MNKFHHKLNSCSAAWVALWLNGCLAAGGKRFEMESKDGKTMGMNYFTTPDETMESPDAMLPWARLAMTCAVQAKAKAKPKANKLIKRERR